MDMSKYLGLFATEASEHLDALGRELLLLENGRSQEQVDSVFRHAHSVKGMAASMGFDPITELAHRVEDLLGIWREDREKLTRDAVDLVLRATDAMIGLVRRAAAGEELEPQPELVATLAAENERLLRPASEVAPTRETTWGRLSVRVRVALSSPTPAVKAFLVHKKLSALGQIFDCRPPLEDLRAGRLPGNRLALVLESTAGEAAIRKTLDAVADLEEVLVGPVPDTAHDPVVVEVPPAPVGVEPARTVRVKTETLDHFLDGVGELLLATAQLRELAKALPERSRPNMDEGIDRLHGIVKDLHDRVMGARLTPLSQITDRLPRAARDITRKTGRDADLIIVGAEIELDRSILDELADPILHLLRNCLGHGMEAPEERAAAGKPPRGTVRVTAQRDRDRVLLTVDDDGRGMDPERLKQAAIARGLLSPNLAETLGRREALMLACLPGVSTAASVSDLSGRGVGMDAVKRVVEAVGGTLEIESDLGRGTRFTLRLPLTVAVLNVLLIGVGDEIFGLPLVKVSGALELSASDLFSSQGTKLVSHGGELLPVHPLAQLLALPAGPPANLKPYVVVDGDSGKLVLEVDRLLGQEEVVLKPLSRPLDRVPGLAGVTILGSGRPIFILDVPRLV